MSKTKLNRYIYLCIVMACLQFLLLVLIPFANVEGTEGQRMFAYVIAFLFWTSIFAEIIFLCMANSQRKRLSRKLYRNKEISQSLLGIFSFLKNKEAMVVDIMLFLSVILLGIIIWTNVKTGWIIIGVVSVLVLSFNLHCIFNGKNYRYLKELINNKKEKK